MEGPSEEWEIEEYSSEASGGKVSWIWNKGLMLGKKILITGIIISSTPLFLPPLLAISAIGIAASVPSGFFLASFACSEKLMSKLLPGPAPLLLDFEIANDEEICKDEEKEEGAEGFGGEGDAGEQNGNDKETGELLDEKEKKLLEKRMEVEQGLREEKEAPGIEEKRDVRLLQDGHGVEVVIEGDEESGNNVESVEIPFEVTTLRLENLGGPRKASYGEEELTRETREMIERLRDEGKGENLVEEDRPYVEEMLRGAEVGGPDEVDKTLPRDFGERKIPLGHKDVYGVKAVEAIGDTLERRNVDINTQTDELVSETIVVAIVPDTMKPVAELEEVNDFSYIIEPEKSIGDGNEQQKAVLDINTQADELVSETTVVAIVPDAMKPVKELEEGQGKDSSYIINPETSIGGDENEQQKAVLDRAAMSPGGRTEGNHISHQEDHDSHLNRDKEVLISSNIEEIEIADEREVCVFDVKTVASHQNSYVVHGTPKESLCYVGSEATESGESSASTTVHESSHNGQKYTTVPSSELYD
ncbi:hypothetical protein CJ030_MR5G011890 [Morella rubra]|uniref:Uncharacterized protein n=1 Tax=Morella rubra TaxID=262757 RepID=A0A6A1VPH4_9ROSI|nr:hypothetical protein CJ030_MR5G011890 [Morella rubra]